VLMSFHMLCWGMEVGRRGMRREWGKHWGEMRGRGTLPLSFVGICRFRFGEGWPIVRVLEGMLEGRVERGATIFTVWLRKEWRLQWGTRTRNGRKGWEVGGGAPRRREKRRQRRRIGKGVVGINSFLLDRWTVIFAVKYKRFLLKDGMVLSYWGKLWRMMLHRSRVGL